MSGGKNAMEDKKDEIGWDVVFSGEGWMLILQASCRVWTLVMRY